MGNFSSKDGHGPTGAHLDIFHTPPTSPVTANLPATPHLTTPSKDQPVPPLPSPIPAPVPAPAAKKRFPSNASAIPAGSPDWKPSPPVSPDTAGVKPGEEKPGSTMATKVHNVFVRNQSSTSSTPNSAALQEKSVAVSPTMSVSSLGSPQSGTSTPTWRERDSGICPSPPQAHGLAEGVVEECRLALGLGPGQDAEMSTADLLKCLLAEVSGLRDTLQTERAEWVQFQADLQVAVGVADRLRAEAEEELTVLRTAHRDTQGELAASQQRQKEAEGQLVTLRSELRESRQMVTGRTQTRAPNSLQSLDHERPKAESKSSDNPDRSLRGRERLMGRVGRGGGGVGPESGSQNEETKNVSVAEAATDPKGVAKRYLRNLTNEERSREEGRGTSDTRKMAATERSRSLSRLPASSDPAAVQNGTSQSNAAVNTESTSTNLSLPRGRRSLEQQDSWSTTHAGKQEETLNKYNSTLTELPPTKSQDGFSLLLRRHGGSKRNSLLRWCQSRTQGYRNIDITNFSSSWADGLAFCAVYHTYLPSLIPYCTLSPESKRENLSLALKTGENIGITQSLTVDEMLRTGGPDWQRVLGYVESMYRHFEM